MATFLLVSDDNLTTFRNRLDFFSGNGVRVMDQANEQNWMAAGPPIDTHTSGISFAPEDNPFGSIFVDLTHRCNMACANCYLPNRDVPDMDVDWLIGILQRFPRRTRVRLVGAEPTVRRDLVDIIRRVRQAGHLPILMTNGLKLGNHDYVRQLKAAGIRSVYISLNGGLEDDLYRQIDGMPCAKRKMKALDNLCREKMYISTGMIVARGVNEHHVATFFHYLMARPVPEMHFRTIGQIGRYMHDAPLQLTDLVRIMREEVGVDFERVERLKQTPSLVEFFWQGREVQLTQWPDLGNMERGRLTPEGRIEPFFEHIMANDGGY